MSRVLLVIISTALMLSGCVKNNDDKSNTLRSAKGGVNYGGIFRFNLSNDFRSLFPHSIIESSAWYINEQVYEGLVETDPNGSGVIPELAESWSFDKSNNTYTFKIREGVFFTDDSCFTDGKGRELNADDVKFCLDKLCEASPENIGFSYTLADKVRGANEYYKESALGNLLEGGVSGIVVKDNYTIDIELNHFDPDFLNILTMSFCWIFPKEAYDMYGQEMVHTTVGTGPFYIESAEKGRHVNLTKNLNYWKQDDHGNQLPYLDGILISFIEDKWVELLEFKKGNLDMVSDLPVNFINNFFGEFNSSSKEADGYQVQIQPGLNTSYLSFNQRSNQNIFSDRNLRMAFRLAIDTKRLVSSTLDTKGENADKGLVPPGVTGYKFDSLKGFGYDPQQALQFFEAAGYGGGKTFPDVTLTLAGENSDFVHLALAIQNMLEEALGITIELDIVPYTTSLILEQEGEFDVFLSTWWADYDSPHSFLNLLYGKHAIGTQDSPSSTNSSGFKDVVFDSLLEAASRTVDQEKRYALYLQADQITIDKVAIIPLYYGEVTRLLQKNVRNYVSNSLEEKNLHVVYFASEEIE
ncbi:MAG: ABC transporter substrate-binding protein [Bacteroidetes bacterium]|nr:ABC transporter substrate-binding protein [Bacteroidota bacterium]